MDKPEFWRLIEEAKREGRGDCTEQARSLQTFLSGLPPEEIAAFDCIFNDYRASAYRWDLWGAAVVINGGASDDGFEYFRWWLIGQGRAVFEGALAEPDNLADLLGEDIDWGDAQLECEDVAYAAMQAYEEKTGRELVTTYPANESPEPVGKRWKDEELDDLFPKIAAKIQAYEGPTQS